MSMRNAAKNIAKQVASSSRAASTSASTSSTSKATAPPVGSVAGSFSSATVQVPARNVLAPPLASSSASPISIGPTQLNRYEEHYRQTLAPSLLYMTYDPEWEQMNASEKLNVASTSDSKRDWDLSSPYTKNRPARPPRGARNLQPGPMKPNFANPAKDLVTLDRIVLTSFCKEAISNKHHLLPLIAQFRAITGLSPKGSWADPSMGLDEQDAAQGAQRGRGHISILRAKSNAASFKIRPGMAVGVQAVLPRPVALEFLETLVTFVLPRLRTFQGFVLPPAGQPTGSPAATSGVVSLGMGPSAMGSFPQTEINWDAYPHKALGFQIDCITNQRGPRATERARQLLSGLGVPFVRRGDLR